MYINFKFGKKRRILKMAGGRFFLSHRGELCATLNQKARRGRTSPGWTEYYEISRNLTFRLLNLPDCKEAIRSDAAWKQWARTVEEVGFGEIATAVFNAVAK